MVRTRQNRKACNLLASFLVFAVAADVYAASNNWSITLNNTTNTFTGSETTNSVSLNGSFTRQATGFIDFTVGTATGTNAPSNGTTFYGIELPGLTTLFNPILTNETAMISMVTAGGCPTHDYNAIWVFNQWDPNGFNNLASPFQPAFGTFSWSNATLTGTINNVYSAYGSGPIGNFSSFSVTATSCANGVLPIPGVGDRGGTMYMAQEGGAVFRTNGNKAIYVLPQVNLANATQLAGPYTVFKYQAGQSGVNGYNGVAGAVLVETWSVTVDDYAQTMSGNPINPNTGSSTGSNGTFVITSVNDPTNGFITGTLSVGTNSGVFRCAAYLSSLNVLFCGGQTPGNISVPMNMMMVSQANIFTHYSNGATGSGTGYTGILAHSISLPPAGDPTTTHKVYLGGEFQTYDGFAGTAVVRTQSDGSVDSTFPASGTGFGYPGAYSVYVAQDSGQAQKVYVGGWYLASYNGVNKFNPWLFRLTKTGVFDTTFVAASNLNQVNVITQDSSGSGKIYVGGLFTGAGGRTGADGVVRLLTNGSVDTSFLHGTASFSASSQIYAIGFGNGTQAGKTYVGGNFTSFGTVTNVGIARLLSNGTQDVTFFPATTGFNAGVRAVVAPLEAANQGKIYAGGDFTTVDGVTMNYLARLLTNGHLDTTFALQGTGFNGKVYAIAPATDPSLAGEIYVSGAFTNYNGQSNTQHMVLLHSDGSIDGNFGTWNGGFSDQVEALAIDSNGDIHCVGNFESYAGAATGGYIRLTSLGEVSSQFGKKPGNGVNATVEHIVPAVDSANIGRVYVTAEWASFYDGVPLANGAVFRLNPNGTIDGTFAIPGTGFNDITTNVIPISDSAGLGNIYVLGVFTAFNGSSQTGIVRLNPTGARDTSFNFGSAISGSVVAGAVAPDVANAGKVYIGGSFNTVNGISSGNIARLNSNGSLDTTFNVGVGFNSAVYDLKVQTDGKVYVTGTFTTYQGATSNYLARLATNGTLDPTFFMNGKIVGSPGCWVNTVVLGVAPGDLGKQYYGGLCDWLNNSGSNVDYVWRLNADGTQDSTFASTTFNTSAQVEAIVAAIDTPNLGKVYVLGDFTAFGTQSANYIYRLNSNGTLDTTFKVSATYGPNARVLGGSAATDANNLGKIYIGGDFTSYINSAYGRHMARVNSDGSLN